MPRPDPPSDDIQTQNTNSESVTEIIPDALDYFAPTVVNDAYEDRIFDRINPTSGFSGQTNGILKFFSPETDWFQDFSDSYVWLKLKLVGRDQQGETPKLTDLKSNSQLSIS